MQFFPVIFTPILAFILLLTGFYGVFVLALSRRGTPLSGVATWYLQGGLLLGLTLMLSGLAEMIAAIVGYINQGAIYGSSQVISNFPGGGGGGVSSGPDYRGPDLVLGLLCVLIGFGLYFAHAYFSGSGWTQPLEAPRWNSWAAPAAGMIFFGIIGWGALIGFVTALTETWANCSALPASATCTGPAVGSELILALIFIPAWGWFTKQCFIGGGLGPAGGAAAPVYSPVAPPAPTTPTMPVAPPMQPQPAPQPPHPPTYPTA